jgi:hypothetical protein
VHEAFILCALTVLFLSCLSRGLVGMTAEHIGVALALKIPLLIAVTKVDIAGEAATNAVVAKLIQLLTSSTRSVVLIESREQMAELFSGSRDLLCVVPIFLVSAVTGKGLDLIRFTLFQLPSRSWQMERSKSAVVRVLTSYRPKPAMTAAEVAEDSYGHGLDEQCAETVSSDPAVPQAPSPSQAGGNAAEIEKAIFLVQVQSGVINVEDLLYLGPVTREGRFCVVSVRSIRVNNVPVRSAMAGQCATVMVELVDISCAATRIDTGGDPEDATSSTDVACLSRTTVSSSTSFLGLDSLVEGPVSLSNTRRPSAGLVMLPAIDMSTGSGSASSASISAIVSPTVSAPAARRFSGKNAVGSGGSAVDVTGPMASSPMAAKARAMLQHYNTPTLSQTPVHFASPSPGVFHQPAVLPMDKLLPVPVACWEFTAEILVLNHPSKVRVNYQPVVHIGAVRQTARILGISAMTETAGSVGEGVGNGQKALFR